MRRFIALAAVSAVLTLALAPAATAKTTRVLVGADEALLTLVAEPGGEADTLDGVAFLPGS